MSSNHSAVTPSARILERVREDAADLALLATITTHDWKLLSDKNDTQLYEMTGESLSSKVSTVQTFGKGGGGHPSEFYLVRAAATARTDVNAMLDVLRTSNSEDFGAVMKKIFDKQFESGAVVESLSCTTPPPYATTTGGWQFFSEDDGYSANWVTLRAFTKLGGLDGHRDFTMICYQDVFERACIGDKVARIGRRAARDPHRRQGSGLIGVHTFSSMNFKDIPELPKSSKTDRLHFRNSGVVVEELVEEDADGPMVRVSLLLSLMPSKLVLKGVSQSPRMRAALAAGHEVAKKYRKWLQTLALGVGHLAETAKPSVTMQHLSKMTWIESDHCFLCSKTFRTYRRRHHCRFCGEAVCASCSGFVDMTSFDVSYEGSEGSSDGIAIGHRKLDMRLPSDGSGRSENSSPNDISEELIDTRGCNTCVSELQMNLTMLGRDRSQQGHTSSSGGLLQLSDTRLKNRSGDHDWNENIHGTPYPGQDFNRDQVVIMRAGDYERYQQYSGPKMSLSTISTNSYSGLSHDERAFENTTEFMGKAPPTSPSNWASSSFSTSDASLSAFLARDPDLLSLNGLTLSTRGSVAPSTTNTMDDDEHVALVHKCNAGQPSLSHNRASYATTIATNEASNHSQFHFAKMTEQEVQDTERLIKEVNARGNLRVDGRPPLDARRHQPQYQPDFEQSPVLLEHKKVSHMSRATPTPSLSYSRNSSYSSGSTHSDLIQLSVSTRSSLSSSKTDFVVFDDGPQTQLPSCSTSTNDMIPLKF